MPQLSLTPEQKSMLHKRAKEFSEWIPSERGKKNIRDHREHEKYFKEKLSIDHIDKISEQEFAEIYKTLWASNMWGNKDWYITNRLIAPNGLDKIKSELKKLLYSTTDVAQRYNEFRNNVSGFGTSSISEILHFMFPDKFCLWNEKPKTVLPYLGLTGLPDKFFKYQLSSGEEYSQCVEYLGTIKNELAQYGVKDFIDLDILFWHIYDEVIPEERPLIGATSASRAGRMEEKPEVIIDSHEAAEYYLLQLGKMLGYIPYATASDQSKTYNGEKLGQVALLKEIPGFAGERDLSPARNIDVIWFGDDENPKLCFEVEHTTNITDGLQRLSRLQHLRAKYFIVADEDRRNKFEIEMQRFPYRRMKEDFGFISYDELAAFYETTLPYHELRVKLLKEKPQ